MSYCVSITKRKLHYFYKLFEHYVENQSILFSVTLLNVFCRYNEFTYRVFYVNFDYYNILIPVITSEEHFKIILSHTSIFKKQLSTYGSD